MKVQELDTPALTVDLNQLERNIRDMAEKVREAGAVVRPHTKTHKTPEVAKMQVEAGSPGITVAKLGEAEVMADAELEDILIANELIGPQKLDRLAKLAGRVKIRSCVDSLEGARMISEAAQRHGTSFEVLLDVDTGLHRAGVNPEEAVDLGKRIAELPGVNLVGVFSYAAYMPGVPTEEARKQWGVQEGEIAVAISKELQAAGIPAEIVSVAGTPCGVFAAAVPGVTEVRPGTYVFYDMGYMRLGICTLDQCALRIRARVVSRPAPDRAVIDSGSKVLTAEKKVKDNYDPGFGYIEKLPGTKIESLWEEHGVLRLDNEGQQLRIGDVVEIIPNHVCPTINLADKWYGVRNGEVEREFKIAGRGKTS